MKKRNNGNEANAHEENTIRRHLGPSGIISVELKHGRVGKTSLVLRYVNNVFSEKQEATVQASYLTKRVVAGGVPITLSIWDTAGQERFHALGPIYYRDADGMYLQSHSLAH
ncbi:hypothetical protein ZIOFF_047174 [Zingiber officinale]|uniref:Uncharacterized protein n=1 Tax=Zingiber officinale TaxID=94328 RepID=A0A8J5FMI6_ZINOF|nr:hypothetical protein ZIOFF_047174 [Zingiber officinale]